MLNTNKHRKIPRIRAALLAVGLSGGILGAGSSSDFLSSIHGAGSSSDFLSRMEELFTQCVKVYTLAGTPIGNPDGYRINKELTLDRALREKLQLPPWYQFIGPDGPIREGSLRRLCLDGQVEIKAIAAPTTWFFDTAPVIKRLIEATNDMPEQETFDMLSRIIEGQTIQDATPRDNLQNITPELERFRDIFAPLTRVTEGAEERGAEAFERNVGERGDVVPESTETLTTRFEDWLNHMIEMFKDRPERLQYILEDFERVSSEHNTRSPNARARLSCESPNARARLSCEIFWSLRRHLR